MNITFTIARNTYYILHNLYGRFMIINDDLSQLCAMLSRQIEYVELKY